MVGVARCPGCNHNKFNHELIGGRMECIACNLIGKSNCPAFAEWAVIRAKRYAEVNRRWKEEHREMVRAQCRRQYLKLKAERALHPKERKVRTGDRCPDCGHSRLIFHSAALGCELCLAVGRQRQGKCGQELFVRETAKHFNKLAATNYYQKRKAAVSV